MLCRHILVTVVQQMGCFDVRAVPSNRKNAEANTEYQDCLIQQIRSEYKGKVQMCLVV
jgi:Na+-transporting methylmalonyl-CoA/oxaloacetate decarboxylase gamma subunit